MNAAVDKAVTSRLTSLEVEDFKRIRFVKFDLKRGITELSGANGAGKSSVLDSIAVLLDGMKALSDDAIKTTEPIHKGALRSRIRTRIGEMYVTRTIAKTKGGSYTSEIRFEAVGGKPYPATQKQLNDLIGEHNLDPVDFIRLDAKGKFDAFKAFVPGLDFETAKRANDADYLRRTEVNRVARESQAAADLIVIPAGTPAEPIDEVALVAELQEAGRFNTELETRRARRAKVAEDIKGRRDDAERIIAEVAPAESRHRAAHADWVAEQEADIVRLQKQIETIRERLVTGAQRYVEEASTRETSAQSEASAARIEADRLEKLLSEAGELPEPKDAETISQRITEARSINANVTRAAERAKHLSTATKYEAEAKQLTAAMEARETAKQAAIAAANLPIDGIEFGDGEIRYRGAPFDQASTAQKLEVAIARIVALNPKLRLCWIRDASLLDDDSYGRLNELALKYDIDVLIETVRPIGKDAVVLEDGRMKGGEPA